MLFNLIIMKTVMWEKIPSYSFLIFGRNVDKKGLWPLPIFNTLQSTDAGLETQVHEQCKVIDRKLL